MRVVKLAKRSAQYSMNKLFILFLVAALLASGCQSAAKKREAARKKMAERAQADVRDESSDADFEPFVAQLRKAVSARDMNTLASMMTTDFAYVLGQNQSEDRKGEGVFQYWDENGLWPELEGILSEKFVKKGAFMVAPPQFSDDSLNYTGYRAGARRVGGQWKFVYFVNG